MLRLFVDNLLPIFLVAGAGYTVARRWDVDPRGLSQVAFFVFAPCLVFDLITSSDIGVGDALRMIAVTTLGLVGTALVAGAIGRWRGWPHATVIAVVLAVMLPNAGNYGLSAVLFAFGEPALVHATVFFVTSAVLTFTVGVFVASLGKMSAGESLLALGRVPAVWAVAAAVLVRWMDWPMPDALDRPVGLLADASIPSFLVLLGMQLRGTSVRGPLGPLVTATAMRLVVGLAAGVLLARLVGLSEVALQAAAMQFGMPAAVITIVVATQYDVEPKLVTSIVFVTTILSPLTLTPLLSWLG